MAEHGPSRRPEDLSGDTVTSFMFDAEAMRGHYTWQQLESLSRRTKEAADAARDQAEELILQARALEVEADVLDARSVSLHEASQKSLDEGTNPRHSS